MKNWKDVVTLLLIVFMVTVVPIAALSLDGCQSVKVPDANAICENALVKQAVVIAAAAERNIPVQQYVDGLCKIATIVEPFIKEPLKPDTGLGATAVPYNAVEQSLEAARKQGLVK